MVPIIMIFILVLLCILVLILLIAWAKLNPFLAFLIVSLLAGFIFGLPFNRIVQSVQTGMGDTFGSLAGIIVLGAMLGKLVADCGAAQQITRVLMKNFGQKNIQWALVCTGFIIGIPMFYTVGFVLMVPLILSVSYEFKIPAIYIGLPMLAALSVTHGFLPPHPSPTALVMQFHANMGITLLYGLILAIPAILIAGPLFSLTLKKIPSHPLTVFQPHHLMEAELPGTFSSVGTALLPVFLLIGTTVLQYFVKGQSVWIQNMVHFISEPLIIMLISLLVASYTLGIARGKKLTAVMNVYGEAVKDISMILLIITGAGALKQVLSDSGVSQVIATALQTVPIHPLVLGWLMAAAIRASIGSATVAGLTTAGIILPLMIQTHTNPNLMVLAVGAGSLMFSHVNDGGFWLFKEYFNLSMKDTFRSWSLMEIIIGLVGLAGVLLLNLWI